MNGCGKTDRGFKRSLNEDYIFTSDSKQGIFDNLYVIADGIGGLEHGDYASKNAINKFVKSVNNMKNKSKTIFETYDYIIKNVNEYIFLKASKKFCNTQLGTTLVACTFKNKKAYVANIGDSRLYIIDKIGRINCITKDHTVESELKKFKLDKSKIDIKINKQALTRCIGYSFDIKPDYFCIDINEGDKILMCTDGLYNYVDKEVIREICMENISSKEKVDRLILMANLSGGNDNVSAILIEN